jgi:phosphate transport system substrate-binding protein
METSHMSIILDISTLPEMERDAMKIIGRGLAATGIFFWLSASVLAQVTGAGSTFVTPVLTKWSEAYAEKTGVKVSYQSIGSAGGITQVKAGTVDFGATDAPLKPEELKKADLEQFPLVIGGIVPILNIEGVKAGNIKFTGPLLADIFLGKVKTWNDPAIQQLNPDVKFPAAAITVVHRSDGSGTTFNWVNYLSKVSPEWRDKVGEGTAVAWPTGAGGKGNEGVAALVMQTRNSIGYVEYAHALQNKLVYGLVKNAAGEYVKPNATSFQAAAESADWSKAQDFYLIMTDSPGANVYPITATVFVLMPKSIKDAGRIKAAYSFFNWALTSGQKIASDLDFVPLPKATVDRIQEHWKAESRAAP